MTRAILCLISAASIAVLLARPAGANVVWDWSAEGGLHQGTFVTDGTSLGPGTFTIQDVSFTASTTMPLGSVSDGTYHMPIAAYSTTPPYTLLWNGVSVTSINAASNQGINALIVGDDASNVIAIFGSDSFGSHLPGDWEFQSADFTIVRGGDLMIVPRPIPTPEIAVQDPAQLDLVDGGTQDFGALSVGDSASLTFTIKNVGTADLTGLAITMGGSGDFALVSAPSALPLPGPNGSTSFTVRFAPTAAGLRSGALHIASNDADENPFDLALTGTGLSVDCAVSAWSDWTPCCNGTRSRTRTVLTPPSGGGAACPDLVETQACANPSPVETILSPAAGSTVSIYTDLLFIAAFTDSAGLSHTGTWTIDGVPTPAAIVEPAGGAPGSASLHHSFTAAGAHVVQLDIANNCGGAGTASVTLTVAPAAPFPQTTLLDDFNGGTTLANWTDMTSAFTVRGNTLMPNDTPPSYIEWNTTTFGVNQEAFVTLRAIDAAAAEQNIMLKTQGAAWNSGNIEVSYQAPNSRVAVNTFTPPLTWTNRGMINGVTFVAGDRFGARAFADGTVQVFQNDVLLGSVSVAAWSYAALGGRIGLSTYQATTTKFDDFGGGDISPSAVLGRPLPGDEASPSRLSLSEAYPNPTSHQARFTLALPRESDVSMSVLDIQGREVWSAPQRRCGAGLQQLVWDGHTRAGSASPGVYLARIRVGEQLLLRRIAVVR